MQTEGSKNIEKLLDEQLKEDKLLIALANVPEANNLLTQSEKTAFVYSLKTYNNESLYYQG